MAGAAVSNLPCLDEKSNFSTWKFRIKLILQEKQVEHVLGESEITEDKSKKDDAKAKSLIAQSVSDKYIEIIKNGRTAKEMMSLLENIFERKSVFNRFHLKRKLISLKCNEPLQQYLIKFSSIISDLEAIDVKVDEEDQICYLLSSLPKEYDHVITSIETMASEKKLSFDFVKARLLDAETKISISTDTVNQENAFMISCYTCGKSGHKSYECNNKESTGNKEQGKYRGGQSQGRGYGQHRRGRHQGRVSRGRGFPGQGATSLVSESEIGFIASESVLCAKSVDKNYDITFIVDSGCTQHLVSEQFEKYMTDIQILNKSVKILVANGQYIHTNKKGNLKLKYKNLKINVDALIVENITYNLLSVKKITEAGFDVKFNKYKVVIKGNNSVIIGYSEGRLYKLNANVCHEVSNISTGKNQCDDALWHKRLGHLNRKCLGIMHLPISNKACSSCMEGKATRGPFRQIPTPRSKRVAEMLHTDIAGPVKEFGLNGILISIRLSLGLSGSNWLQASSETEDWWQAHLSVCMLTFMFSFLFLLFPTRMSSFKGLETKDSDGNTGLWSSLRRLVRNKALVTQTLALSCLSSAVLVYVYYDRAYVQARYRVESIRQDPRTSRALSDIFRALVIIFFVMIFRVRFSARRPDGVKANTASRVAGVIAFFVAIFFIVMASLGCDTGNISGLQSGSYHQPSCSNSCGCNSERYGYSPVCSLDTGVTYFSPCHAGCSSYEDLNGFQLFQECGCSSGTRRAVRGSCTLSSCMVAYSAYQVVYTVMLAVSASSFLMQGMAVIRAVRPGDKVVAVGSSLAVVALLSFVLGHLIYMLISNQTCAYSANGACLLHAPSLWIACATSALLAVMAAVGSLVASRMPADTYEPTTEL